MTYRESPQPETETPPELDRSILVAGLNGVVLGLHRANGESAWKYRLLEGDGEVSLAMRFGVLVASAFGPSVDRIDYFTGKQMWRAKTTGWGRATILLEHDCIVVAKKGHVDCFNHQGTKLWSSRLDGFGTGSVALGFPGNIVQADTPGSWGDTHPGITGR